MIVENKVSEDYRKYLISISIFGRNYQTVWGTDLEGDDDKLIIGNNGEIIFSTDFEGLKNYLLSHTELLFDRANFLKWLNESENIEPYATYNFDQIQRLVDQREHFLDIEQKNLLIEVNDILNLIGDFAYQKNDQSLLTILEGKNTLLFKDYVYTEFLWNSSNDQILDIEAKVRQEFNEELFIQHMKKLYDFFVRIIPSTGLSL